MDNNELGKNFELYLERMFGFDSARRSSSSGASARYPVDVESDRFVIEAEATQKQSYRLTREFWEEVRRKATNTRIPLLGIQLWNENRRLTYNLIAMDVNDFVAILERLDGCSKEENE